MTGEKGEAGQSPEAVNFAAMPYEMNNQPARYAVMAVYCPIVTNPQAKYSLPLPGQCFVPH